VNDTQKLYGRSITMRSFAITAQPAEGKQDRQEPGKGRTVCGATPWRATHLATAVRAAPWPANLHGC